MANVINRTTKKYLRSVNTPDYPISEWIINPDMSAVEGIPVKWWLIEGNTVREMTQPEKDELAYSTESIIYLIAEKQLLYHKNGHEYEDNTDAIINPMMPACELKYTKVVAGLVVEMTAEEKAIVDAPQIEKELSITEIKASYLAALDTLDTIINTESPTSAQVVAAVKAEAQILKKLLKFVRLNVVYNIP